MTISLVVHRKEIKIQNVKKKLFFPETSFLHKTILKIASIGVHKKDMKKRTMKIQKVVLSKLAFI